MKETDLPNLFLEGLKDLYSAESQIVESLPKVIEVVDSPQLKKAITSHFEQTKEHATRLAFILKHQGQKPDGHKCKAMEGLIKEVEEQIKDFRGSEVLDAALIVILQKIEHYEISGYGSAIAFAKLLSLDEQAALLDTTLLEEKAADEKLTELATNLVNPEAMNSGPRGAAGSKPRAWSK